MATSRQQKQDSEKCILCDSPIIARKMCNVHYRRMLRHGDPTKLIISRGYPTARPDGYFVRRINGKTLRVHRLIMEQQLGRELLPSEIIHHKNGNRQDNSIDNLQILTQQEHLKLHYTERGNATYNTMKNHCRNGHAYTPENTFFKKLPYTGRDCRTCMRYRSTVACTKKKQATVERRLSSSLLPSPSIQ